MNTEYFVFFFCHLATKLRLHTLHHKTTPSLWWREEGKVSQHFSPVHADIAWHVTCPRDHDGSYFSHLAPLSIPVAIFTSRVVHSASSGHFVPGESLWESWKPTCAWTFALLWEFSACPGSCQGGWQGVLSCVHNPAQNSSLNVMWGPLPRIPRWQYFQHFANITAPLPQPKPGNLFYFK